MRELRHALGLLRRRPEFTLVAIAALSLGIGSSTAVFTVVNAVLLRPLGYPSASRLVIVWDRLAKLGLEQFPVSVANYIDYKTANRVFDQLAAFSYGEANLTARDQTERVPAIRVSANLLPMLGAAAAAGRLFTAQDNEPGRGNVALLSDSLWRRRFGAERGIVGKNLTLDGRLLTVVGILPPGFFFSAGNPPPEIWTPVVLLPDTARTAGALELIGRLKPGVTLDQARAGMQAVAGTLEERYHPYRGPHGEDAGYGVSVRSLRDELDGSLRRGLLVLLAAVAFLLLIACANVASLLLARAPERRREMAVRQALGADRLRLVRQLITEGMVLAIAGGSLGLLLAYWCMPVFEAVMPALPEPSGTLSLDWRVLVFSLGVSISTGLLFGAVPALEESGESLDDALKESGRNSVGGRRSGRLRRTLIAGEIALSLVLVIGAGLLINSFVRLLSVDPGFRSGKLITGRISLPDSQYPENQRVAAFYRELLAGVRALPGVESASLASRLPLTGGPGGDPFSIEGRAYNPNGPTPQVVNQQVVGDDFFRTMQIPLLAGRLLLDRESQPSVVINATMARGFWRGSGGLADAIGRRILLGAPRAGAAWLTIVGVVGDVRYAGMSVQPLPQMYVPLDQEPARSMALVVRTAQAPGALLAAIRTRLFALDPNQPLYDVKTMEQRLAASVARPRFQTLLLGVFAGLALVLAAIGVYGVVAQNVAGRTREIGVRMALGASSAQVLRSVLSEALAVGLTGIAAGSAGALALARLLSTLLYQVAAFDPATFLGAAALLLGVVLAASYIPARRAARVDPVVALRWE